MNQSSDVQAVATLYGISDLLNIGKGFSETIQKVHASPAVTEALLVNGPAFRSFAGAPIMESKEKALNASPIGHIKGVTPRFLSCMAATTHLYLQNKAQLFSTY